MEKPARSSQLAKQENTVRVRFALVALAFELLIVVLYGAFVDYAPSADAQTTGDSLDVPRYYGFYQDVHVMIFIGFGFLMTFLSKYGFGAVGMNFLMAAMSIQWGMFLVGLFHWIHVGHQETIGLSMTMLIEGDFAAGAVLITFGAVLGKTSPVQMVGIMFIELIFYNLNYMIGALKLGAVDMGGSIFVHTFGAYFGLAAAWVLGRKKAQDLEGHEGNGSSKISDTFAMVGTIFLWMFWPSFNGALAGPEQQHRVIINTVLSLCGSCIGAFLFSQIMRQGKFSMVDIQNATLAGGVAIGSAADLVVRPWAATVIGIFASGVSVWGYTVLMPILEQKICLFDTCGVHNLHGMPGLIGGITGAIASAAVGDNVYGQNIGSVYPARGPQIDESPCPKDWLRESGAQLLCSPPSHYAGPGVITEGRTAGEQAGIQFLALVITVAIAITGGLLTGCIVQNNFFQPPNAKGFFSDHVDWDDVEEDDAIFEHHAASHDHSGHALSHDRVQSPPTGVGAVPGDPGELEITV